MFKNFYDKKKCSDHLAARLGIGILLTKCTVNEKFRSNVVTTFFLTSQKFFQISIYKSPYQASEYEKVVY